MQENPYKQQLKQQYLKKYRDLLKIPQIQAHPIRQKTEHQITPSNLDNMHKIDRIRSKSLKQNYNSFDECSLNSLNQSRDRSGNCSRIYTANEMNEIIRKAQGCGLVYNSYENDSLLQQNRKYLQQIRDLQNTWHYQNIRRIEQIKLFNKIPMDEHVKNRFMHRKFIKLEDIIYEYPKMIPQKQRRVNVR